MHQPINQAGVVACVEEFFTTTDSNRRAELNNILIDFKKAYPCTDVIQCCIGLVETSNSTVQSFGVITLYETVKNRSEDCISNLELMDMLKTYLIDSLTTTAAGRSYTVIQKLQSTLALLALYSIPDVWPQPVQDLTHLWANCPELLLRVLAEIAAEFSNIHMPLTQRSALKTELHRISEEIILIIHTVMNAKILPSLRQAAVECVERWVQLPGIGLQQWTDVLSKVFAVVSDDNTALTSLLNILAENEEIGNLEQLLLDICAYITRTTTKKIASELSEEGGMDEAYSLVTAVCRLSERAVPNLIRDRRMNPSSTILTDICLMLVSLSNWPGLYPIDEKISDIPSIFWTCLREHLTDLRVANDATMESVIEAVKPMYIQVCQEAVRKMAYPSLTKFENFDKEQREMFVAYRKNRCEVSVDAFYIVGNTTLDFLNQQLEQAIQDGDICRTECVLFLWQLVADYITEEQYNPVCQCLEQCTRLIDVPNGKDCDRMGCSLMLLFNSLTHLIQCHENAIALQSCIVGIVLSYINRPLCAQDALVALENIISTRNISLYEVIGSEVSEKCYNYFMENGNSEKLRLIALKCIGFILSTKSTEEVMNTVKQMISSYVQDLTTNESLTHENLQLRQFQINIFSSLFATLHNKENGVIHDSPVTLILQQAAPVFRSILANQGAAHIIGDRVCEAVRSAICSYPEEAPSVCEVFPFVAEVIDLSLLTNASTSCNLAKSTVLTYNKTASAEALCEAIARWFALFEQNQEHKDIEEWLGFMYHVIKKNWRFLHRRQDLFIVIINNSIRVAGNALVSSREPNVVKGGSQILAEIATQTMNDDDAVSRQLLADNGPPLVQHIFLRIQSELMRTTVEALAEALYFYVKQFPTETRKVIGAEERGESPMVAAMFREVGNLRNFKKMTLRLNQACRKV